MLYANPPLGLAYLASYINKTLPNVKVRILDQIPPKQVKKIIKKDMPDIVGLTSVSENWFKVKKLAKEIKTEFSEIKLVIGGIHVTTQPSCFKDSAFDYGIIGEGEIPFSKLIQQIMTKKNGTQNLTKIKGLLIRSGSKIVNTGLPEHIENLDEIPSPNFKLLNMKYYSLPSISSGFKKTFIILTSRGCPYNCKFCSSSCFWRSKIRFFSAGRVVKEIEELYRRYRFRSIFFGDDLFAINKGRIKEIIILLKNKGLLGKIEFFCGGRANLFDDEMAELLKELGVKTVSFGFESGSKKMLKWLKGGNVTVEENKRAISICKKYNIEASGFFIIGSPYETLQDMRETYSFIRDYCSKNFIIYQTIAYPGTEIWKYALKEKLIKEDMYEHEMREFLESDTNYLLTKEVSKEDFNKVYQKIRSLKVNNTRKEFMNGIRTLRLGDFISFFNPLFIKKVFNLRYRFIKRIK